MIAKEIEILSKEIITQMHKLDVTFWEVYVNPANYEDWFEGEHGEPIFDYEKEDNKTWLYYGARAIYYKICVFLELKNLPLYLKMFTDKFQPIIIDEEEATKGRGSLYQDDEPSMIIIDNFREFLKPFQEFNTDYSKRLEVNKLKQILENTIAIISKTKTKITNEASIYRPVKWFVEIAYPTTRSLNKARFISKFKTYHPDILVPELSSAVEYKYIRKGSGIETYLDEIKIDADNYDGDREYKYFYAVVFFEDKSEINPESFKQAVKEKKYPNNWTIFPL